LPVRTSFFGDLTDFTVKSARDLQELDRRFPSLEGWAFRGHATYEKGLATELEQAFERHGIADTDKPRIERLPIREFGRKAHLYLPESELPAPDDTLEWISLMRHYGAPTRLLDWTYSVFVAAFFALAASDPKDTCFIWAVDTKWLNRVANEKVSGLNKNKSDEDKTGCHFRRFFLENRTAFVSTENPRRVNRRLATQRGVFLCPGDVQRTFAENLEALSPPNDRARFFEISPGGRAEIAQLLYRLNIDEEIVFPGIEGWPAPCGTGYRTCAMQSGTR
jgi:hypothetical protein